MSRLETYVMTPERETMCSTVTRSAAQLMALALLASGCTHLDPVRVKGDFGKSHQALLAGQYFDPEATRNPSAVPPSSMDGVKAENILKAYREDISDRNFEDTKQPLTILTTK